MLSFSQLRRSLFGTFANKNDYVVKRTLFIVEHVEEEAVQLKEFLSFIQFWVLSKKHSKCLSNLLSSCPEEHFEEKLFFLGKNPVLKNLDFCEQNK